MFMSHLDPHTVPRAATWFPQDGQPQHGGDLKKSLPAWFAHSLSLEDSEDKTHSPCLDVLGQGRGRADLLCGTFFSDS